LNILTKSISISVITLSAIDIIGWAILRPPAVECIVLESGSLTNTFSEIGEVIPVGEVDLFTKTGGKLLEVKAVDGSPAIQGELLFVFDSSDLKSEEENILAEMAVLDSQIISQIKSLEMQKSSLEADKASTQIKIEQTLIEERKQREDADSAQQLYDADVIAAQDLTDAQMIYEQTVKSRELLDAQLKFVTDQLSDVNAEINDFRRWQETEGDTESSQRQQLLAQKGARMTQLNLQRERQSEMNVASPRSGLIRDSSMREGQIVPPGTKLCSIYQPDQYEIDCYILVENTAGVNVGDEVEITLRLRDGDKKYQGYIVSKAADAVDRVSKVGLSEKRVKIVLDIEKEAWADIGPYWPVEIRFVTAQSDDCLLIPKTALSKVDDDIWQVWVVRDGKANALTIERGLQTPSQVEVKNGLAPGDIIIKNAKTSNITEGQSVRAVT
jgi:HlyD family secretion protein